MNKVFLLGIAGGSGSGKTYMARDLARALGPDLCTLIYQDNYYIDQSKRFDFDGGSVNFDHPNSLDFDLLAEHLKQIKNGKKIEIPIYDFKTHTRLAETIPQEPKPIIIVDGILVLHAPQVFPLFDDSVFVDTPEDLRFERRLKRDVEERGRTVEGVKKQFFGQVKPMHDQFVEPSKSRASFTSKDLYDYHAVLAEVYEKCLSAINKN